MSGFKAMVANDIHRVFLNPGEFAEKRTVCYGFTRGKYAERYVDIPVVLTNVKMKERPVIISSGDHAPGLYMASVILYCAKEDIGGHEPEHGQRLAINDEEGGGGFFQEFYVAACGHDMGMLRVELEAIDE